MKIEIRAGILAANSNDCEFKASTLCARFRGTDGKLLAVGMEDGAVSVVEVATKVGNNLNIVG